MNIALIDIGGTNIKYALSDEEGTFILQGKQPTEAFKGADAVYVNVCGIIDSMSEKAHISGIAISTAGQVDVKTGNIVYATDGIPGYTGFALKDRLKGRFKCPVSVENDVNCSALGNLWKGNMDEDTFIALTIGTGIGGAIVLDGRIFHGASGSAGEIGHMTLIKDGLPCNCGDSGCYERYASAQALEKQIIAALGDMSTKQFFNKVRSGDTKALAVFSQWIDFLTEGLKSLVHILNPPLVMIGGGITAQGALLEDAINDSLRKKIMKSFSKPLKVKLMTMGNDANLYGALYWFLKSECDY
ncbi:ROK family protein (putative glucokinase) [Dethiosulfatibacter aminovorans DSM 17477]|uniref:ROK family protein (Putative glucokinase) n=1 Tax=Dethiosulfatibacter aminovorans DSM 17477 TaxID=1121476 RepID=A0A1M6E6U3_9FIRM|nr:ROK family protein [Dethiosulfatibacter aminovorans]SHI80998.1 ROK family protein (putative glucokinase) [Dethiosulfatibacter aminovorans DSM 17477]